LGRKYHYEVYWTDGFGFMMAFPTGISVERTLDNFGQFQTVDCATHMAVVGNRWDNPELLQGVKPNAT